MQLYLILLSFWMSLAVTPKKIISYLTKKCVTEKDNTSFISKEAVRVCAIQMRVRGFKGLKDFLEELSTLALDAVEGGAQLLVFPEYVGLLSATLLPNFSRILYWFMDGDTPESLDDVSPRPHKTNLLAEAFQNFIYECYTYTFSTLARLLRVYIVAGSCIVYEQGVLYNRSVIFDPEGQPLGAQDKTVSLCFDKSLGVQPHDHIEVFDTPLGKLSVILGTDAYYFENFRIATDQGAQLIAVPDGRGGVTSDIVRCRADENDVFAVYSCFTGTKNKQVRACILAPFDMTVEQSGTVAETKDTKTSYVSARINLEKLIGHHWNPSQKFLRGDYIESYFPQEFPTPQSESFFDLSKDSFSQKSCGNEKKQTLSDCKEPS